MIGRSEADNEKSLSTSCRPCPRELVEPNDHADLIALEPPFSLLSVITKILMTANRGQFVIVSFLSGSCNCRHDGTASTF